MAERGHRGGLLFEGSDWSFDDLQRSYEAIEEIALTDLGLDLYPNQIEIISSEQMLDAYSSAGMPLMYRHWSFGKHFIRHERQYSKGMRGLAYEIIINSNPCVSYCLEENTMALQVLVMAHAACGHNHFFKNNHLFRQWTDAEGILDYLNYARGFIERCEEEHGPGEVERLLDAAHALQSVSIFRHRRPPPPSPREERARSLRRQEERERAVHYLWDRLDLPGSRAEAADEAGERRQEMNLPEENLLYFIETYSPTLKPWQRDVLRIVRDIGQYFYPQRQTKVMNEGCACFVHYHIINRLHETGRIDDGAMLEMLHNHTNVLTQPDFDDPRFGGFNPYALGFAMMRDIQRICARPTDEDREWFPEIAGSGAWREVLKDAWANYRDESFIQQFLSPKVMRDFHMFALIDDHSDPFYTVAGIHNETGYHLVRAALARSCNPASSDPAVQVTDVDLLGDRVLRLQYRPVNGIPLEERERERTLAYCRQLWGYPVVLGEAPAEQGGGGPER